MRAVTSAVRIGGFACVELLSRSNCKNDSVFSSFEEKIDTAFIALHGRGGEDGTIQGALELMGIPYTGPGVMASATAMDKIQTKRILTACGIPTPAWQYLEPGEYDNEITVPLPLVVKPSREGSTIGISIVREQSHLSKAVQTVVNHKS